MFKSTVQMLQHIETSGQKRFPVTLWIIKKNQFYWRGIHGQLSAILVRSLGGCAHSVDITVIDN